MDAKTAQAMTRFDPDAVECEHRPARGKSGRGRRWLEVRVQPTQRASPEKPLVEVSHQYGRHWHLRLQHGQQPAYLRMTLRRAQPEMGCQDAQRCAVAIENQI